MEITEEGLAALVAQGVARARSAEKAERDADDLRMVEAAEAARASGQLRYGFLRLVDAIGGFAAVEAERAAVLSDGFAGLAAAFELAIAMERFTYATRQIKVALFDADGYFCGVHEGRADLVDLNAEDPYRRVPWRSEWDGPPVVEMVRRGGVGPDGPAMVDRPVIRPRVPHLSEIVDVADEVVTPFAAYPVPDLD